MNEIGNHKQITKDAYLPERQRIMKAIVHDGIHKYNLGGSCVDGNQLSKHLGKLLSSVWMRIYHETWFLSEKPYL